MPARPPRVAVASCAALAPDFAADADLVAALRDRGAEVVVAPWDDPSDPWAAADVVVIRSTWDYTGRRDAFLAWADRRGDRLLNPPPVVRWNSDKRYLAELAAAGLPTIPTAYVGPDDTVPALGDEVVVKPTVSAGAKDTGRFGPAGHAAALALVERIRGGGRTAMVQPYLTAVDDRGETAVVCVDGEPVHALRKGAVLRPDEVAPMRAHGIGAAEAMYDPDLVRPTTATAAELALAADVMAWVVDRFATTPLYARVDVVPDADGTPVLMELEAVEPALYLDQAQGAADHLADAILRRT